MCVRTIAVQGTAFLWKNSRECLLSRKHLSSNVGHEDISPTDMWCGSWVL